jgi:hypothetical protein
MTQNPPRSRTVYLVCRVINGQFHTAILHPVKTFGSAEVAGQEAKHADMELKAMLSGKVVVQTEAGPRAICTVSELLGKLGIKDVGHTCLKQEIHEANILLPEVTLQ